MISDGTEDARPAEMYAQHEELWARKEIEECLLRYTRGIDRHDDELAMSAYHPDARDDHVTFVGSGYGLVEWAGGLHSDQFRAHSHHITNTAIELEGDQAHVETYFIFAAVKLDGFETVLGGGRYVDRFERREGVWGIADRACVCEWGYEGALEHLYANAVGFSQDRDDIVYRRPFRVERAARVLGEGGDDAVRLG
jgi:hypothetical protein